MKSSMLKKFWMIEKTACIFLKARTWNKAVLCNWKMKLQSRTIWGLWVSSWWRKRRKRTKSPQLWWVVPSGTKISFQYFYVRTLSKIWHQEQHLIFCKSSAQLFLNLRHHASTKSRLNAESSNLSSNVIINGNIISGALKGSEITSTMIQHVEEHKA